MTGTLYKRYFRCLLYTSQVREVVPAGYRLVGITPNPVVISEAQPEGAATVTNLRRKPPGFHDEDEKKNVFRVIN